MIRADHHPYGRLLSDFSRQKATVKPGERLAANKMSRDELTNVCRQRYQKNRRSRGTGAGNREITHEGGRQVGRGTKVSVVMTALCPHERLAVCEETKPSGGFRFTQEIRFNGYT